MALNAAAPLVLLVAGTDSSGGAGLSRDIETLSAFGARACLAVTAVTAQTDRAVTAVDIMPARLVEQQMRAALAGGRVSAVKLGMLASPEIVAAVRHVLDEHPHLPLVVDPVLMSSSGRSLMVGDPMSAYESLYARATLIAPNLPELGLLTGHPSATSEHDAVTQAQMLLDRGAAAVLVKGGHALGAEAVDLLVSHGRVTRHAAPRLAGTMRGTGCALASAIAANLAFGCDLAESISPAKAFVLGKLRDTSMPDKGVSPRHG